MLTAGTTCIFTLVSGQRHDVSGSRLTLTAFVVIMCTAGFAQLRGREDSLYWPSSSANASADPFTSHSFVV